MTTHGDYWVTRDRTVAWRPGANSPPRQSSMTDPTRRAVG